MDAFRRATNGRPEPKPLVLRPDPEQARKNQAAIELLDSWLEEGDEQEQRETWEYLKKALDEGVLREDLYYRLNVILLQVPPLRERMDDVPILAMHFLRKYAAREAAAMTAIAEDAMNVLLSYSWPGNVRELENAVERGVVLGQGEKLRAQDLPPQVHRRTDDQHVSRRPGRRRHQDRAPPHWRYGPTLGKYPIPQAEQPPFHGDQPR